MKTIRVEIESQTGDGFGEHKIDDSLRPREIVKWLNDYYGKDYWLAYKVIK